MTKHILIVEDDLPIQGALKQILEREGYDVTTAINGREALQSLKANPEIDLIITDLLMPEMNGYEFMMRRKNDPRMAEIPVIAMTAATARPGEQDRMGFTHFIIKPIDVDSLLDAIERILGASAA